MADFPKVIFGTSFLGNLYIAPSHDEKKAVVEKVVKAMETPVFDSAGKYGAGLALEELGMCLEVRANNYRRTLIVLSAAIGTPPPYSFSVLTRDWLSCGTTPLRDEPLSWVSYPRPTCALPQFLNQFEGSKGCHLNRCRLLAKTEVTAVCGQFFINLTRLPPSLPPLSAGTWS